MKKSLAITATLHPDMALLPLTQLARGQKLDGLARENGEVPVLFIANPHGLHARYLKEADAAGFRHIIVEKPVCVSFEELSSLKSLRANVSVCHGYRQMWGPQLVKEMLGSGELGEIISVEGRYWQSSAAQKSVEAPGPSSSWKNDVSLNGNSDTLVDLGAHWVDLMLFFADEAPFETVVWKSFLNAEASHRDTHVHLALDFRHLGRTLGSLSKTAHGEGNHLEFHVIGAKSSVAWTFQDADSLRLGRGGESRTISRKRDRPEVSGQPPFHGLGWLEGYLNIISLTLLSINDGKSPRVPTLPESLRTMQVLLSLE